MGQVTSPQGALVAFLVEGLNLDLTPAHLQALSQSVMTTEGPRPSPMALAASGDPRFLEWVSRRARYAMRKDPEHAADAVVNFLCNYDGKHGWLAFQEAATPKATKPKAKKAAKTGKAGKAEKTYHLVSFEMRNDHDVFGPVEWFLSRVAGDVKTWTGIELSDQALERLGKPVSTLRLGETPGPLRLWDMTWFRKWASSTMEYLTNTYNAGRGVDEEAILRDLRDYDRNDYGLIDVHRQLLQNCIVDRKSFDPYPDSVYAALKVEQEHMVSDPLYQAIIAKTGLQLSARKWGFLNFSLDTKVTDPEGDDVSWPNYLYSEDALYSELVDAFLASLHGQPEGSRVEEDWLIDSLRQIAQKVWETPGHMEAMFAKYNAAWDEFEYNQTHKKEAEAIARDAEMSLRRGFQSLGHERAQVALYMLGRLSWEELPEQVQEMGVGSSNGWSLLRERKPECLTVIDLNEFPFWCDAEGGVVVSGTSRVDLSSNIGEFSWRFLLAPNGDILRTLSAEEYIALNAAIAVE